jgi:Ca2+-binding RTX toxin-like protein
MANSGKDTNGSQFFVTQGTPRALDFNHTVWGQLVRGFAVRDRIIASDGPDPDQAPDRPVIISRMSLVENRTDAVLFLRAARTSTAGSVTVTVTGTGGSDTQTFDVDAVADAGQQGPTNTPPFLVPPTNRVMPRNGVLRFDVASVDVDTAADLRAVDVAAELEDLDQGTVRTEGSTVIFTPRADLIGPVRMLVGVRQSGALDRGSTQGQPFDTQLITVGVGDRSARATGIANLAAAAGTVTPGMVVATFTDLDTSGTPSNWSAQINWGDGTVGDGVVSRLADGTFRVTGSHEYPRAADDYPLTVTLTGNRGAVAIVNGTVDARDIASITRRGTLVVNGSSGNDTIVIDRASDGRLRATVNGVAKLFALSRVKRLQINGFEGNDAITVRSGVPRAATIDAGAGNDTVNGGDGADLLLGGGGNDRLFGNAGDDTLVGGAGTDLLDGGTGDNELIQ